jgi:hypothetical protein
MDTIDDIGRRAAGAVQADAAAIADAEADALLDALAVSPVTIQRPPRRWAILGAAAAVAAAIGAGVVVVANREPAPDLVPATTGPPHPVTTPPPTPPPTPPASSVAPSTTAPAATTTAPAPSTGDGLAVSYRNPPPFLEPQPLATLRVAEGEVRSGGLASMESGVVVLDGTQAHVVGWDGAVRTIEVDAAGETNFLNGVAAGPGEVLYAIASGNSTTNMTAAEVWAIPLSGEQAGTAVAASPVDMNVIVERPAASFGHGRTGLVDRIGRIDGVVAPYVDENGDPWAEPLAIPEYRKDGDVVSSLDGSQVWPLEIERGGAGNGLNGPAAPSPAPGGGAVWWDWIGPRASNGDYSVGTMEVIAFLAPDGSATWRRVPEGWAVVAADVWGTVLAKRTGPTLELAVATTSAASTPPPTPAEQAVMDYLTALAARDYEAAAHVLGNDGLSLIDRPDLAVIRDAMGAEEDLAQALREWCDEGPYRAACWMPASVAEAPANGLGIGDSTVVVARYVGFSASFRVNSWEGRPSVYGLPPLTVNELPLVRELIGVHALYADDPSNRRLVMASATGTNGLQRPASDAGPFSVTPDGYAITWTTGEPYRATVTDTTGAMLCSIDERIVQLLGEPGAYRAVVVREGEVGPSQEPAPQPSVEMDCQTGVETPTNPWAWSDGPTYRSRIRVGHRDFFVSGSDHGDQIEDDAGTILSGDDTVLTTPSFSSDGSVVTYGELSGSANPWLATRVVARDTLTGEHLWETDVNAPIIRTWTTDDLIVAEIGVTDNPLDGMSALAVLDATTGELQLTVPAAFDLVHIR